MKPAAICRQVLLVHDDRRIAEWVKERSPVPVDFGRCTAFGILQDGALVGGVVFNNYRRFDVWMSVVLQDGAAVTRQTIRTLCEYAFGQLNVRRVTSITGKKNRKARKALRALGFIEEGSAKYALDGVQTAVQYGLLRENCRWINNE